SWASAIAGPPQPGDRVFRWNGTAYESFAYSASGWIPREPLAQPGEALWFSRGPLPPGPAPVIVEQPHDVIVPPGADASFGVTASGLPVTGYQWFRDGAPIESPFGTTLVVPSVTSADA